ncbi:MAG: DNA alkylation repair protein [Candidatus Diapherotrites archaeon]|nr:DNA alkylation repair protein [Candidatus Diapherotrites archaeon]
MRFEEIIKELKKNADPKNVEGMARFGISPKGTFGVCTPKLWDISKKAGKDHALALKLWASGYHEARILACMIDEPEKASEKQLDKWAEDFDSWDTCDQCCMRLFRETPFAYRKVVEWSSRKEEFVKRTSFSLMAILAVGDKKASDKEFEKFLPIIKRESVDERNYVKKAVNWALRQVGKRNLALNKKAIATAKEIQKMDSKSAKWIAADALRELQGEAVQKRLKEKNK